MLIVIIVLFATIVPVVYFHSKQAAQSYKNYSNGIMNHNASLSEFIFEIDKTSDEVWSILKVHNAHIAGKEQICSSSKRILAPSIRRNTNTIYPAADVICRHQHVTHVLVNDPTTGYGIFIENMLDAAG